MIQNAVFFIQWSEKFSICASSVSIHLNLNVFIGLTDVPDIPRGRTDDGTVSVRVYREDIPKSTGMVGSEPNRLHIRQTSGLHGVTRRIPVISHR